jgi:hypothetical protein
VEFSRELGEWFCKVSQPRDVVSIAGTRADGESQDVGAERYHERLTKFIQNFKSRWIEESKQCGYVLEDIRAIVIAGEVSSTAIAKLGNIAQEVIGTGIPEVLADFNNPTLVTARGAAVMSQRLGRPCRTGMCMTELLTDEDYERKSRQWDELEKKIQYKRELLGRLESPEEWAMRKPKLITAAGEV